MTLPTFDIATAATDRGMASSRLRQVRRELGVTQQEFSRRYHVPLGTLRDWEQAKVQMPAFAIAFVELIAKEPVTVDAALNQRGKP